MKHLSRYWILLAAVIYISAPNYAYADATYYLVRHAEKVLGDSKNPQLTNQGKDRAEKLAQQLSIANISQIYSTDFKRTQETVKPLSELLDIPVEIYDPSKLKEFSEKLKEESGQIVIVGHSNTTPSLVKLLSGISVDGIDESEYENLYEVVIINGEARLNRSKIFPITPQSPVSAITLDNKRFKSGSSTFNMLYNQNVVGQSIHTISKEDGQFILHEKTTIEQMGINADIYAKANSKSLSPISISMTGSMGAPVDINLNWTNNHVSGHSEMGRALHHPQGRLQIDQKLPDNTFERTSLIMLAHLISINENFNVKWFNGYDGFSRKIEISYEGEEQVTVPAGEFNTYKILYQGGAPSQLFYISKTEFPEIVKIEIPTMPWTYELVESRN